MKKNYIKTMYLLLLVGMGFPLFAQEVTTKQNETSSQESNKTEIRTPIIDKVQQANIPTDKGDDKTKDPKITSVVAGGQTQGASPTASPEVAFQNRFADIPVNTFTGTAQVPIPIYTLSEGNISVPISLGYNASGVKAHEVSAWTGINWILSAGATITRIVRGIPDEGKLEYSVGYGDNASNTRKGFYQHGLRADNDNNNDSEPDIYLLNISGSSYKFTFETNTRYNPATNETYRKAVFFPDADIELTVRYEHFIPYAHGGINYNIGKFTNWKVVMANGVVYTFAGTPETIEASFEVEAKTAQNQNIYQESTGQPVGFDEILRYAKNNKITSAWYLTQISSPFGNHIDFSYNPVKYAYFKLAEQEKQTNNCTFTGITKNINKVFIQAAALAKISTQRIEVVFNKETQVCSVNPNQGQPDEPDSLCTTISGSIYRDDIDGWQKYPRGSQYFTGLSTGAKVLNNIYVIDKNNTSQSLHWSFEYQIKTSNFFDVSPSAYGYSDDEVGNTHNSRFFLQKIILPDNNFYRFTYKDAFTIPSRLTERIDHWGFFSNTNLSNTGLFGKDYTRPCTSLGNNKDTDGSGAYAQYYTLDSLVSSTGVVVTLEYDNHEANNFLGKIGGSRIRKITNLDVISGIKTIKAFDYIQEDGTTSSGFIALKPIYHFTDENNNEQWNSGLYAQLLGLSGKPAVGYRRVVEKMVSPFSYSTGEKIMGYTISEFAQSNIEIDLVIPQSSTVPKPYTVRPWTNHFYHDYFNGVPVRNTSYNSDNQILTDKTTYYDYATSDNTAINGYRSFYMNGLNYNFENTYTESLSKYRIKTELVRAYPQDGINTPVENTTTYTFKDEMDADYQLAYPGKHNQVVKITGTDSYGYTNETLNKYVFDFDFGLDSIYVYEFPTGYRWIYSPHVPLNQEAQGIYQLQQKKIGATIIETIAKKNDMVVSATYQNFYPDATSDHQIALGKESYQAQELPLSSFNGVLYTRNTAGESFTKDNHYDLRTTIEKYNPLGMPSVTQTQFGTRDSIVYDATNTIAIEHHYNIRAYDKNRTKTEYENLIFGASKEISTNDLEIRKEYYANGKIKQIKDKDGNVLKHYQYYYKGQTDDDPILNTDTDKNRIITRIPRIATTDALSLDYNECMVSVVYLDGSGRTLQNVAYKASPNYKDLISGVTLYDEFARPNKTILPVESSNSNGSYTHVGILDFNDFSSRYPSDYVENLQSVIAKARIFYGDNAPYSEVNIYENSPLSRVLKSYGAGQSWRDNDKGILMEYQTSTGIKKFTVSHNSTTVNISTYNTYELTKKTATDEQGNITIEYTDKSGNTIQKDVQVDATNYLSTCYIFDDIGRHRYTLNPKAYNALYELSSFDETNSDFQANGYAYGYDGRNRIITKKLPSVGLQQVVYNRLNQVVLTQDADEATRNVWNFLKYDGQGRNIGSGQITINATRNVLQEYFDTFSDAQQFEERAIASGNVLGYTNRSFPSILSNLITENSFKNIQYFDDYIWRTDNPYSGQISDYDFKSNPLNSTAYSNTNAIGLATGSLHKIDNFGDFWFPSVAYFDDKNRTIQTINYQDLYARNQNDILYNFVGDVLQNRMIYRKAGANDYTRLNENLFDNVGRVTDSFYTLTEGTTEKVPRTRMSTLSYDAIGRLSRKQIQRGSSSGSQEQDSQKSGDWTDPSTWSDASIPTITQDVIINPNHIINIPTAQRAKARSLLNQGTLTMQTGSFLDLGTTGSGSFTSSGNKLKDPIQGTNVVFNYLQDISYSYNIRGQMRGINLDANDNVVTTRKKLFSYKLDYHEDNRYYDNSISKQTWKNHQSNTVRSYEFSYDKANRLTNATFAGLSAENYSVSNTYDANGNILSLQRYGKTGAGSWGVIDNLSYSYFNNSDQLQQVNDATSSIEGFRNGTNVGDDYEYYADGKLKKDLNRNISLIEYNYLDLVSKVTRSNGDFIEYFYSTKGEKRRTERTIGGQKSYTFFDGEMIYTATGIINSLNDYLFSEIQTPEGRFTNNRLEYSYTDHLGNLRLSYRDSSGVAAIVQTGAFDAWGFEITSLRYIAPTATFDKYTWQGKEDLSEDGLEGWSNFGWRIEDRTIGRWFTPDPEDQFESISTYAYCANNPVSHIDPDGRALPALAVGALIGAGISALTYTASVAFSDGGFNNWNWGSFAKQVGIGGISGLLSAGIGQAYGAVGDFSKELSRAFSHGLVQANVSAYTGGDVGSAFLSSFISSGIGSATNGFSKAGQLGVSALTGAGLSTALNGSNFWENLAYSSAVVGLNHLMERASAPPKPTKAELQLLAYAGVISEAQLLRFGISMTALRSALGTIGLMFLVESDNPYYVYEITGKDPDLVAKYGVTQQADAQNRPQSQIKGIDGKYFDNAPHKWRWILERTTPSVAFATEKWLVWNYWSAKGQMPYAQKYPGSGAWLKLLDKSKKK